MTELEQLAARLRDTQDACLNAIDDLRQVWCEIAEAKGVDEDYVSDFEMQLNTRIDEVDWDEMAATEDDDEDDDSSESQGEE